MIFGFRILTGFSCAAYCLALPSVDSDLSIIHRLNRNYINDHFYLSSLRSCIVTVALKTIYTGISNILGNQEQ